MAVSDVTRRWSAWLVPSIAAACTAALAAGGIEGAATTSTVVSVAAAAGFAAWLAIPGGLVLSIAGRLAWSAWTPEERVAASSEGELGVPRYVGWLAAVVISLSLLWHGSMFAYVITSPLKRGSVHALAISLSITALVCVLMILVLPISRAATWLARELARVAHRRWGMTLFSPRAVTMLVGLSIGTSAVLLWIGPVKKRVGSLQIEEARYVLSFIAVLALAHVPAVRRFLSKAVVCAAVAAMAALAVGASLYQRSARPFSMLDVWSAAPTAGRVIGAFHDFEEERGLFASAIEPEPLGDGQHRDIILITIDTVRGDSLKLYGGSVSMPNLEGLAEKGAVFDWAIAPSNNTRRSMSALALGLSPPRVRGRVAGWALRLDPRHVLLAERLRAGGYQTQGFFCCRSHFGRDHRLGLIRGLEGVVIHKGDAELLDKAAAWLRERDQRAGAGERKPLFLWLHLIDPHLWHDKSKKPKKKVTTSAQRYELVLGDVDRALAPLLRYASSGPHRDGTVVIVTSDHGEGLGSHGIKYHSSSLYNSEIRVPLIVSGADVEARRVAEPVSLVDLAPTILELAGFRPPAFPRMDGRSLVPALAGDELEEQPVFSYQIRDRSVEHSLRAVIASGYKLIVGPGKKVHLFDLSDDPHERASFADKAAKTVAELEAILAERARTVDSVPPF